MVFNAIGPFLINTKRAGLIKNIYTLKKLKPDAFFDICEWVASS